MENVYKSELVKKLMESFKFDNKAAEEFVENFLKPMYDAGYNVPNRNCRPIDGKDVTVFGSVFEQIEKGGHKLVTPDGRDVNALYVAAERKVEKDEDGEDSVRIYILCPEFSMGDVIVALQNCESRNLTILHGISDNNHVISEVLGSVIW